MFSLMSNVFHHFPVWRLAFLHSCLPRVGKRVTLKHVHVTLPLWVTDSSLAVHSCPVAPLRSGRPKKLISVFFYSEKDLFFFLPPSYLTAFVFSVRNQLIL